ncbi:MAG TPA: TIR domain-containing protein, partial [Thermoanaerobaculia bacterium]|nr:TIR domain-containing protein [Thermoanaerobaculia bacterium]
MSYSHRDEDWKDLLVQHLRVLEAQGALTVWDDRRIAAGEGWRAEIEAALHQAAVAVLLISADFLASAFIRGTEVPRLLERRQAEGLVVVPLIVRPCAWREVTWLKEIQCRPRDGVPLAREKDRVHQVEEALAALATEIRSLLATPPLHVPPPWAGGVPRLDIGRLPTSGKLFVGREPELARLDVAWEDPRTHVLTFVAFGGVGKSTLVARWLDPMAADGWRGARRVLDWSFYSQGTEE